MHIESSRYLIARPLNEVYLFINDFRNFEHIMPEQVQNYKASCDECSFDISGMGSVFLVMKERVENQKVVASSTGKTAIQFELIVNLAPENDNSSSVTIHLDAELSPMLAMMAKTPLNNFINMLAAKLKAVMQ